MEYEEMVFVVPRKKWAREQFKLKIFKHLPHNPDLAVRDNHLFLYLKTFPAGQRLKGDRESKRLLQDC